MLKQYVEDVVLTAAQLPGKLGEPKLIRIVEPIHKSDYKKEGRAEANALTLGDPMQVLKLEDAVSPGYRLFLERLVETYMARKNLTVMPGFIGDRAWYMNYLITDICQEQGEDVRKLFTGHARTRKRLQARQYQVQPSVYDEALDMALKQAVGQHFTVWLQEHPDNTLTDMFRELGLRGIDEKEQRRRTRIENVKAKLAHALATPGEEGLVDYLRESMAALERLAPAAL